MNIKEAGRYANYLNTIINTLSYNLNDNNYLYQVVDTHLKNKANVDAADEDIEITIDKLDCSVVDLMFLLNSLIDEKMKLAMAIEEAKQSIKLDWIENGKNLTIDSAIEYNIKLHEFTARLKCITSCKNSEMLKTNGGIGKKFNVEGNQVDYRYDIKTVKTINFDRNVVNDLYKKLLSKSDEISKQIDTAMVSDSITFEPIYSIHDSVEDVVLQYLSSKV